MFKYVLFGVLPPSAESHWRTRNYIQNLPAWKRKLTCNDISARWISRENHGVARIFVVKLVAIPIQSMYGIFIYIWLVLMVNIGKYTIHGWYGINDTMNLSPSFKVYCMRHPGGHVSRDSLGNIRLICELLPELTEKRGVQTQIILSLQLFPPCALGRSDFCPHIFSTSMDGNMEKFPWKKKWSRSPKIWAFSTARM